MRTHSPFSHPLKTHNVHNHHHHHPLTMSTPPPPPPRRRVPPPCWTQEETLALIQSYRDRWFSLKRGNLRSSDWEAVASLLPSKTPIQCRHKIEKLRKRYRTEKQRCLAAYPGRFFSSWDLFPLLDSMGIAFPSTVKNLNIGFDEDFVSNIDVDDDFGGGFGVKVVGGDSNLVNFNANTNLYHNLGSGFGVKMKGGCNFMPNGDFDHYVGEGVDIVGGFPVKSLGDRSLVPPGFKPKNYDKIDGNGSFKSNFDYGIDKGSGISSKMVSDRDSVPLGFRSKPNVGFRALNRNSSSSRLGVEKKIGSSGGVKRGRDPVDEMASLINVFAERFVKMETMKMEMTREIEKMRMEMELKRNEMILDSQQQIVNAFAKALSKKKKVKVVSPNANGNGDEADRDDA